MNTAFIFWIAAAIEVLTYIFRFGFDFHSRSIQHKLHLPLRVHHMYIGILTVLVSFFFNPSLIQDFLFGGAAITLFDIGIAITLSDMYHHFIILPLFHQKVDFP
ncbi:hypothetical protein HZA98_00225 [Candidatus Woesearchaeota archaeon]|nr:hypothetical protein [Candidatus Woesearchaeota archaeon]